MKSPFIRRPSPSKQLSSTVHHKVFHLFFVQKNRKFAGDRRIRVHTLCLPTTNDPQTIFNNFDIKAAVSIVAKLGKEEELRLERKVFRCGEMSWRWFVVRCSRGDCECIHRRPLRLVVDSSRTEEQSLGSTAPCTYGPSSSPCSILAGTSQASGFPVDGPRPSGRARRGDASPSQLAPRVHSTRTLSGALRGSQYSRASQG